MKDACEYCGTAVSCEWHFCPNCGAVQHTMMGTEVSEIVKGVYAYATKQCEWRLRYDKPKEGGK